ncbi:DNA polymerase delta small subunit Cdc1 [Lithohypha guttulata]|nr:DNA polymerase delta small subunit Cdc1 [Lithohypha guttulata]
MAVSNSLLHDWHRDDKHGERQRPASAFNPLHNFHVSLGPEAEFAQQFADLYYLRLTKLQGVVKEMAEQEWSHVEVAGEKAIHAERVLDVRQGELSWTAGTIYVDLPLKPNVIDEVVRGEEIAAPPPQISYFSTDVQPRVMLEDPSGRLRLAGAMLKQHILVTGVIVAVLGTENANGEFEVLDMLFPDLPPQPLRWARDDEEREAEDGMKVERQTAQKKKVAFVSGLEISGTEADPAILNLLTEYLLGEALDESDQDSAAGICRLVIAGNSISPDVVITRPDDDDDFVVEDNDDDDDEDEDIDTNMDAYGFNPLPSTQLDNFISELLPSIPVTIMAGETDLTNYGLPQRPIHTAIFPRARAYASFNPMRPDDEEPGWFETVTNPWDGDIEGWRMQGNSGLPLNDLLKYFDVRWPKGVSEVDGRLKLMESMLKWRSAAPTAPDTIWTYPFQDHDPFVLTECPHVFFAGNQPRFDTCTIEGPSAQQVRLFTIPRFRQTGEIVLLDMETLDVEIVKFEIQDQIQMTTTKTG